MLASIDTVETVCPSCGGFVAEARLDPVTGWCSDCTITPYDCKYCGDPKPCHKNACAHENFLERNADALEQYMIVGRLSLYAAIDKVRKDNRPKCIVCGRQLLGGKQSAMFCNVNRACRKMKRKYLYLYQNKGLTKSEAIGKILELLG